MHDPTGSCRRLLAVQGLSDKGSWTLGDSRTRQRIGDAYLSGWRLRTTWCSSLSPLLSRRGGQGLRPRTTDQLPRYFRKDFEQFRKALSHWHQ